MSNKVKYSIIVAPTPNVGDDVQSLATALFLPRVDYVVNRELMDFKKPRKGEKIKVIMNGWFNLEPIGARDLYTRDQLRSIGIDSYFSGCLTLTLSYFLKDITAFGKVLSKSKILDRDIVIVDLKNEEKLRRFSGELFEQAIILTHYHTHITRPVDGVIKLKHDDKSIFTSKTAFKVLSILKKRIIEPINKRFKLEINVFYPTRFYRDRLLRALLYVSVYANARLIITSRLHVALPAASFGTPVIFVHDNLNDPRFSGLIDIFNSFNVNDFEEILKKDDIFSYTKNPGQAKVEQLRSKLIRVVENFLSNDG